MKEKPEALGVRVQSAGIYGCEANPALSVVKLPNIPEILNTPGQKVTLIFSGASVGTSVKVGLIDAQSSFVSS